MIYIADLVDCMAGRKRMSEWDELVRSERR
jgi:hypothetical protein